MIDPSLLIESYILRTKDDKYLHFNQDNILLGFSGFGMTNFEYEARRGYKSDIMIVDEVIPSPRNATISFRVPGKGTRKGFWEDRRRIINFFRPNRNFDNARSPFEFTIVLPTEERFSVTARYASGLEFESIDSDDNSFGFNVTIGLICFDPFWFASDEISVEGISTVADQLIFPITFPIFFDSAGTRFGFPDEVIDYQGTWKTFPDITLQGPYSSVTLENKATEISISLGVSILSGETRRVYLDDRGFFRVEDSNGDNKLNELIIGSNFADFYIFPNSELPIGADDQNIVVTMLNGSEIDSGVIFTYKERYVGI